MSITFAQKVPTTQKHENTSPVGGGSRRVLNVGSLTLILIALSLQAKAQTEESPNYLVCLLQLYSWGLEGWLPVGSADPVKPL